MTSWAPGTKNHYNSYRHYTIATWRPTPVLIYANANQIPVARQDRQFARLFTASNQRAQCLGEEMGDDVAYYLATRDYITLQILAMALKRHGR